MNYSSSILNEFAAESLEHIADIEEDILNFFKENSSDDILIDNIFRSIHSIKGAAGFIQLENIEKLSHAMENLLSELRSGKIKPCNKILDVLLESADFLTKMLKNVSKSNEMNISELLKALNSVLESQDLEDQLRSTGEPCTPEYIHENCEIKICFKIGDSKLNDLILNKKKELYLIRFDMARVSKEQEKSPAVLIRMLMDAGEVIDSEIHSCSGDLSKELPEGPLLYFILYSTSLNRNILMNRFSLSDESFINVDIDKLFHDSKGINHIICGNRVQILLKNGDIPEEKSEAALLNKISSEHDEKILKKGVPDSSGYPSAPDSKPHDIRIDLKKLDVLINLVGELIIAESMVTGHTDIRKIDPEYFGHSARNLRRIISELQDAAISMRMIPLSKTFKKMNRLIHDISRKLGKKCRLEIMGEETELDKTVIEQIKDPLVHIVRNSLDHGIESPEERKASGKPETGTIRINAGHQGEEVFIRILDDGRGMDYKKIYARGVEKGLIKEDEQLKENDILQLIFEPGFSTSRDITDISGRGVGLDVVRKNMDKLKGRTNIRSAAGQGTAILLRIPLTMAIIDGMLVRVGNSRYTIPMLSIRESFRPVKEQITTTMDGQEIVKIREKLIPVIRLHELYKKTPKHRQLNHGILIHAASAGRDVCLFVDDIIGNHQTVIKSLPDYITSARGISGCTILSSGEVSLILDVACIINMAGSDF